MTRNWFRPFVKNIPLLIDGFSSYKHEYKGGEDLHLLLVAPHHRKNSAIYQAEAKYIQDTIAKSEYKNSIHITNEHLSLEVLRNLYAYVDLFVCTSMFDGMPLTPLEYVLANNNGAVILSDTIGAHGLLFPNSFGFHADSTKSLSIAINQAMKTPIENRRSRMRSMKKKVNEISLERWLHKLLDIFE